MTAIESSPIMVGVSACLLGQQVRYDGGHKRDRYITDTLGKHFTLIPVCPEAECGMPTPREMMRLEGDPANPCLMTCHTRIDRTGQMRTFCNRKVLELEQAGLSGFIFKERSPSCGVNSASIHKTGDMPHATGPGLFAAAVVRYFPQLPVVEAEGLTDESVRERFIERVSRCNAR